MALVLLIAYRNCSSRRSILRTTDILIPCVTRINDYEHLLQIVKDYLFTLGREFEGSIQLDGETYTFDFNLNLVSEYYTKVPDVEYKGQVVQCYNYSRAVITHSVSQMLDALPMINPFNEFSLGDKLC